MAKILRGHLDRQQKSNMSWIVTTIKQLIRTTSKEFQSPVFSSKWTQEAEVQNSNIMVDFNRNLGK